MKRFLLTGLILAVPVAAFLAHSKPASAMSPTYHLSIADQWQQKLLNDMQEFQNLFTHTADRDQIQQQLNQQIDQILDDMNQFKHQLSNNQTAQPVQGSQTITRRIGVHKLPRQSTTGHAQQTVTSGLQLAAGDAGVSSTTLQTASKILQDITLPTLEKQLNQKPNGAEIALFSSKQAYGQALLNAGVPRDQINAIVSNTGGITLGNTVGSETNQGSEVWIPLYNLKSQADLANVLTHELTHVIFNQQGIGDTLPTWINEGFAWHDGLNGEAQVDPNAVQNETNQENQIVSQVAKANRLLPLNASESDILSAGYNVEWVDYLAVEHLIQTYGEDEFRAFLADVPHQGVDQSFQNHFGQSISQFENSFTN